MKVNLVGSTFNLGELLWRYGVEAYHNCLNPEFYDLTLIGGLWDLKEENMQKPCIALAIGSDVYRKDVGIRLDLLPFVDTVLLAHEAMYPYLTEYIGFIKTAVWKVPFDSKKFLQHKLPLHQEPSRDTILYCLSPDHCNINDSINFIRENPFKKITILGAGYQDFFMERFPNVVSVRRIPYDSMPKFYRTHRDYRLWYNRKDLISIMVCEALYMGLKVYGNDEEITKIPVQRFENVAIPKLIKYMEAIL